MSEDVYELDPRPMPPRLPGTVIVREDLDGLLDAMAADLLVHANNCVRAFGDFHLALSGGSTPTPFYRRLMIDPGLREFPWKRTHLWIVDERRVAFDDERSNFTMISELIGDHAGIPGEQVHPIFALADDADAAYERTLRETLAWREPGHDRLDYVLLGMGADGHTASLFPRSPALTDPSGPNHRLVRINSGQGVTPPDRVTMTFTLLNASRFIAVMVTGAGKRAAVARVSATAARLSSGPVLSDADRGLIADLPILGIRPLAGPGGGGELRWYLDDDACPRPD